MNYEDINEYHFNEALARIEMVREILEGSIKSHCIFDDNKVLITLYDEVQSALGELSSEVCSQWDNLETNEEK